MTAIKVGITGGIGAGKSVVSNIFKTLGFPIFNSDLVAKQLMEENIELKVKIVDLLGEEAYINNKLNRPYISKIVFNQPNKIKALNNLVHPLVRETFEKQASQTNSEFIFNEAAILFETGAYKGFDEIILVTANEETRISRVIQRDAKNKEEVVERINNQLKDEEKRKFKCFEIENDTNNLLLPQVLEFIKLYSTSS